MKDFLIKAPAFTEEQREEEKKEPKKILGVKFPFQLGSDKKKDKKPEKSQ